MKTFAYLALLGLVSTKDTTGVWQLKSVLSHRDEQVLQNYYGDVSSARANARPPMRSHIELDSESDSSDDEETNVQTEESKVIEELPSFKGWHASMEEFPGTVN